MEPIEIWTKSGVHKVLLTCFRGYSVQTVRQTPYNDMLGRIQYRKKWLLVKTPAGINS
jgi:hypothetical protein